MSFNLVVVEIVSNVNEYLIFIMCSKRGVAKSGLVLNTSMFKLQCIWPTYDSFNHFGFFIFISRNNLRESSLRSCEFVV